LEEDQRQQDEAKAAANHRREETRLQRPPLAETKEVPEDIMPFEMSTSSINDVRGVGISGVSGDRSGIQPTADLVVEDSVQSMSDAPPSQPPQRASAFQPATTRASLQDQVAEMMSDIDEGSDHSRHAGLDVSGISDASPAGYVPGRQPEQKIEVETIQDFSAMDSSIASVGVTGTGGWASGPSAQPTQAGGSAVGHKEIGGSASSMPQRQSSPPMANVVESVQEFSNFDDSSDDGVRPMMGGPGATQPVGMQRGSLNTADAQPNPSMVKRIDDLAIDDLSDFD
jgi:hypothetical protein